MKKEEKKIDRKDESVRSNLDEEKERNKKEREIQQENEELELK